MWALRSVRQLEAELFSEKRLKEASASYGLLALILILGALPPLLNIILSATSDGSAISLDICHPAQPLDTSRLLPLAVPIRIAYRIPMAAFGAPRPFLLHRVTGYIPDIIPPRPNSGYIIFSDFGLTLFRSGPRKELSCRVPCAITPPCDVAPRKDV
jgi:hypothetical protein